MGLTKNGRYHTNIFNVDVVALGPGGEDITDLVLVDSVMLGSSKGGSADQSQGQDDCITHLD